MELPIPKKVKKLWDEWNLRGGILMSLTLQLFLMLCASRRQRSRSSLLLSFIWLAYLLADWVAAVCIGLITKTQGDSCRHNGKENDSVLAFWASFLLLHLGGPDSITSFALEDNEFWLRHLIGLVLQVLVAAYSFFLSLPENKLWPPTLLVFFVGTIKFAERTFALYLASSDHFAETILPEPHPGRDYEEAVAVYSSMRSVEVQTRPEKQATTPNVGNYGKEPHKLVGLDGNEKESLSLEDKIKLLEKAHRNFESFKGLIVGLLLSSKERESSRNEFLNRKPDEAFKLIEYELSFMYQVLHTKVVVVRQKIGLIFSNWTLIAPIKKRWKKGIAKIALKEENWSGTVSQYNMIRYCLDERPVSCVYKLARYVYMRGILDRIKIWLYSSTETVNDDLKSFIFEELRTKSLAANTLRAAVDACSQRGDWALLQTLSSNELKWSVREFQYAESLLVWHIATDLCYRHHDKSTLEDMESKKSKKICKLLSDYMFSLLVTQRPMLAPVLGNWHIVFQDTCAEAMRFFNKHPISGPEDACKKIISVRTDFRPAAVKGRQSKSVLFDASILAKELRSLDTNQWKLMSRVWVELLSYAAINCRPIVHAQQPSNGGELLTFTWLLMNHLGLGTQFYEQELQAGIKMVATK
ncbi:hypothetical protein PanWU01x14_230940 [Parasponia andersonii]|uniref:DUF4220 domain-containing protein n=1 Tax=Parasponia andersonii TaxID=3476 RepID=A0A2P5BKJ6_PARAD|nr:hypothetical protein PanWU01x14_230940 [Parasponia andersonii]